MATRRGSVPTALAMSPDRWSTKCRQRADSKARTTLSRRSIVTCAAVYPTWVMAAIVSSAFAVIIATVTTRSPPIESSSPAKAKARSTKSINAPLAPVGLMTRLNSRQQRRDPDSLRQGGNGE